MGEVWVPQGSFASGELSPSVHGLVTSEQFRTGCYALTNSLLTSTGSARKRFGTQDIASTTSGFPAALFGYVHGGRRFVVQFVSQDDDAGDLNTANRQFRVIDAETRAFINFGDNAAHGPFTAFGSTAAYHHHFTATQLRSVYAFQDGTRIVFCHKDRPPLFLERAIGAAGAESWKYGLVGNAGGARVEDFRVPIQITETSATQIDASADLFSRSDIGAYWRIGGHESSSPATFIYGAWWRSDLFVSPKRMTGARIFGVPGADAADWTGPYVGQSALSGMTISSSSSAALDSRTFTSGTPVWKVNHIGMPFIFAAGGNSVLFLITGYTSTTVVTAVRIDGVGGTVTGTGTITLMSVGYTIGFPLFLGRTYLRRHPIYSTGMTGSVSILSAEPLAMGALGDEFKWLPPGHETTFDDFNGTAVGGSVFLNGGEVVVASATSNGAGGGGYSYGVRVKRALTHQGPTIHWGLGWSHGVGFPRCGVARQARHFFGGFETVPAVIVGSETGRPDNLFSGADDDSPMSVKIIDSDGGIPVWMESGDDLLIGTTTAEGAVAGEPLTSSNLRWKRQSSHGGNNTRPLLIGPGAIFASAHGLREMVFRYESDGYVSPDLTDIAKHLFEDAHIAQIEYLNHPLQTVYIRDQNDKLFAMAYYRANGVVGFSPFTQPAYPKASGAQSEDSTIESIAAVRFGGSIADDELWIVRRFTSGGQGGAGSTVRRIERMATAFGMDQTVIDASPTTTTISSGGLFVELLGAFKPRVTLDGVDIGVWATSVGGVATYVTQPSTPDEGEIGRSIHFEMVPLVQDPGGDRSTAGATVGRVNAINSMSILLNKSRGGLVGGRPLDPTLVEFTGWRLMPGMGVAGRPPLVSITHDLAYAFEVAGLNLKASYG